MFKLFLCDVGLLSYKLFDGNVIDLLNDKNDINCGALYESVIAQELKSKGKKLYYYNNKKNGEVDFIVEDGFDIIPIEVKSGKDYKRHVALSNLLNSEKYDIKYGITLSNNNLEVDENRLYLPIYMIMFLFDNKIDLNKNIVIDISALK